MAITKTIIHYQMVKEYHKQSATSNYVFGFVRNGLIYAVQIDNADEALLLNLTYVERRSTKGWELKYRPTKAHQELLLANAAKVEILGSWDYMEADKVNHNNNRGDWFEDMATIRWNGKQPASRSMRFTECGDFNANGIEYQAKFGSNKGAATFTNEKTLARLNK